MKNLIKLAEANDRFDICYYGLPFGLLPEQLDDTFPLAQTQVSQALARPSLNYDLLLSYLRVNEYRTVLVIFEQKPDEKIIRQMKRLSRRLRLKVRIAASANDAGQLRRLQTELKAIA